MAFQCTWAIAVGVLLVFWPVPLMAEGALEVRFQSDVQPILIEKCARCHGKEKQNAGLNVASEADLIRGGESGVAIVPGKPEESLLFQKIRDAEMPPEGNEPLTKVETELIERWIAEGAKIAGAVPASTSLSQHDIIPIMLLRCTACHGGRRREADLDLRTKEGMIRGGKSGPAVVAGNPSESLLIRRIKSEEMPPRRQLVSVSVKPMESGELRKLETWIADGMPESPLVADVPTAEPDPLVSDEDRAFWSFRPPSDVALPVLPYDSNDSLLVNNPIDRFVLAKLQERGLSFSPEADRIALIRRLTLDLLGLPPTPEEVAEFIDDPSPMAYEALVERILASPRHGERWGRHWLDVAGYADSEGAQNEDRVRPNMWRYRDYVIRALNMDKPYDRFLHEQLAGDELADYEHTAITDEIYDNLVATGFLRTAPDRTFANITNFVPDRLEVIADEVQILGSSILGLTLHCARCHSHKFDPLPQRDYYRLTAILKDALDEHDWLGPEVRQLPFVPASEREAWEHSQKGIDSQIESLQQQVKSEPVEAAKKKLEERIKELEKSKKAEPTIRALWSRGTPSPTYILQRGNYLTAGREVGPGVPSMLTDGKTPLRIEPPWAGANATGRRLAFARWLTSADHPLTSRVMVNRIWKHHFGVGIVATLGNFGKTGAPPTHPELLDWLAKEFIRNGWSMKSIHRLIVTSRTYRQSSHLSAAVVEKDPDNHLLSRMPLRRLEAEVIRDSLLFVAGQLDSRSFGPPDEVNVREDGMVTVKRSNQGERRSVYVLHRRSTLPTMLENFDSPQMGPNCIERDESIVAPQALHMLNNDVVYGLAGDFANRIRQEGCVDRESQIQRAYQFAFSRPATDEELRLACEALDQLTEQWKSAISSATAMPDEAPRRAMQNYCHALMNSAAFLYAD